MARDTRRREELAVAATDYVLGHGLIGLSLRPLAADLGTSDRMLLYHFNGKDDLVATVLRVSSDRSVEEVRRLPPADGVRAAVLGLWAASTRGQLARCQRLYVEAAALGLLGQEVYARVVAESNRRWEEALAGYLEASGCPPDRARRAAVLLDAAFMGFHLDLPLSRTSAELRRELDAAVEDVAEAVAALAAR